MAEALSPQDRDLMIRTVIGEAGNQPDMGRVAVAHVILNRLASGKYGSSLPDVVLAPSQFEPWANPQKLMSIDPNSPQYQRAATAVDGVLGGQLPDVTGGATHFFAPAAQAALGRPAPKWASGEGQQIYGHTFFAPEGRVDGLAAISKATGTPAQTATVQQALGYAPQIMPQTQKAPEMADDFDKMWGLDGKSSPAPAANAPTAAAPAGDDFDRMWGTGAAPTPKAVPRDAKPGPNGLMWNADGGYDPKTGELVMAGKPMTDQTAGPMSTARSGLSGFAEGLPIVGPYAQAGVERGAAAIRALTGDQKYSDALRDVQAAREQDTAAHPTANTVGQVAGAVTGYVPLGVAGAGAAGAMGMAPTGIFGEMALSGGGNALLGAADAKVRGESPALGALFGAAGGAAAIPAGKLVGNALGAAVQGVQGMLPTGIPGVSRGAANIVNRLIQNDDPAAVRAFLDQNGSLAMLADAGPSARNVARGLTMDPADPSAALVTRAISERNAGRTARLTGDLHATVGPEVTPSHVQSHIAAAQEALGPDYQRALSGASAVDTAPLANNLDASSSILRGDARTAVQKVRSYLNVPGTDQLDPHPQALLETRHAIDGMLAGEKNPAVIRQLTIARQAVDGELAGAVPGIKDVDAKYAELARQGDALQQGGSLLDSGKTATRPQDLAVSFPESANPQGTMVGPSAVPLRTQQGLNAEVYRLTGTKANDLSALKTMLQGEGGWNTNKLATVLGPEKTNRLLDAVGREGAFQNTMNEVVGQSATNRGQGAADFLKKSDPTQANLSSANLTGIGLNMAKKALVDPVWRVIMESNNVPRNLEIARMLTAQGASRDQILSQLIRLNGRQNALMSAGNAMTSLGAGSVNRLLQAGSSSDTARQSVQ